MMPDEINRLLFDFGLKVTDKNIVELAEAVVITAMGNERGSFPEIAFLSATKTKLDAVYLTDAARLRVRIGTQTEEWHFYVQRNQFAGASSVNEKGLIKDYDIMEAKSPPGRGQLDMPTPSLTVDTVPVGNARVEYEAKDSLHSRPHYYVIAELNGGTYGHDTVVFTLDSFPPESTNVWVRVRDSVRHADRWLHKVQMSSGSGRDTWKDSLDFTDIYRATAGYAQDSNPHRTYHPIASGKELTPEKVKLTSFTGTAESLCIYLCDQFFPDSEPHASVFARYVDSAMKQSWRVQVDTWGFGPPQDSGGVYRVFINDDQHWYHGASGGWAFPGPYRQVEIRGKQGHFPIFLTGRGRMPRIARVVAAGLPHHVTQRGNNHSDVFFDGDDQRFYL